MSSTDIFNDNGVHYLTQYQVAQRIRAQIIQLHGLDAHEAAHVEVWGAVKCLERGLADTAAAVVWESGESPSWALDYTTFYGQPWNGTLCEPHNGFILALYRDQ